MGEAATQLKIIVVGGTASNTGKTTLVCELLRKFTHSESWEAIKLSRGHYRSCGKDPQACCVSGLLSEQAVIRSGQAETYRFGKDTGRFWDAGAANVHWVIATDEQVEAGLHNALNRVKTRGVIIEGTSVLRHLNPNFAILAVSATDKKYKASARWAIQAGKFDAIYTTEATTLPDTALTTQLGVFEALHPEPLFEMILAKL